MHALNNVLGGEHIFTPDDLEEACDVVIWESLIPDDNGVLHPEERSDHVAGTGWYSDQVLAKALQSTHTWQLSLTPLHTNVNQMEDVNVIGAIVNQRNEHWVALKRVGDQMWLLNSLESPRVLPYDEYVSFVTKWPSSYPIFRL